MNKVTEELTDKLGEILDDCNNKPNWCGCYEGDIHNIYPEARQKAIGLILKLLKDMGLVFLKSEILLKHYPNSLEEIDME